VIEIAIPRCSVLAVVIDVPDVRDVMLFLDARGRSNFPAGKGAIDDFCIYD
jgi:CBS domain containing-hemolysin-like protein